MSASATMPYFINPSVALSAEEKKQAYENAIQEIKLTIDADAHNNVKMVTVNCLLKSHLPYFYWVGFYEVRNDRLEVGPYQGTLGCIYIDFNRGVCGRAARERKTQIVPDCHALVQGADHIACDPNSHSEIVVPVFNQKNELIAVFDVDSSLKGSFDEVDQKYLEELMNTCFSKRP